MGNQAVLRMFSPNHLAARTTTSAGTVRRSCSCGGSGSGAGKCARCEEEERVRRSSADSAGAGGLAPQVVNDVLRSPGQPLEEGTRTFMESRLGHDFRHVRVSSDERSAAAADSIHAKAFTFGNRIVFGRNEYIPNSPSGVRLLAHELAHTAQQGSGSPAIQTSLRIGGIDDPQEREADVAADAVLGRGHVPSLSSGGAAIRRQPKGGPSWEWRGVNEGVYTSEGGAKYTVTRSFKPRTESEPTRVTPGLAFARAFVTIKWCKSAIRGTAEVGVDITNQLQQLIPQMLATGNPAQVLRQAKLTPYVQLVAIKSAKGTLNFNIEADVGQQGVSSVRGGVSVETSRGTVDVSGGVDLPQGGRATPTVDIRFRPGSKAPDVQCDTTTFVDTYECRKEENVQPFDLPMTEHVPSPPRTRYLYFDYTKDIVTSSRTQYGKDHPDVVDRNTATFTAIRQDLQEGYRIAAIEGFTSPEGPIPPGKGGFEGNAALSQERADAAFRTFGEGGLCALYREEACFTPNKDAIKPVGRGELYTKVEKGKEAEGKELAEFAVAEFEKSKDEPELKDKERETLAHKRGAMAQAEVVYPLLRRAKITLTRGWVPTQIKMHFPGGVVTTTVDCPRDVLETARNEFAKRDAGIGTGGL